MSHYKVTSIEDLAKLEYDILQYRDKFILCKKDMSFTIKTSINEKYDAYENNFYLLKDTYYADTLYVYLILESGRFPTAPIQYEIFLEHFEPITKEEYRKNKISSIIEK